SIPSNYFDSLADSILGLIKLNEIRSVPDPYTVPKGYFDTLADSIMQKIRSNNQNEVYQELSEVAPLLNTVDKANVFSVPTGYFEELSIPFAESNSAKVISVPGTI